MDPRTMLVDDHIDGLRQAAAEIRAGRHNTVRGGRRQQFAARLRTALGLWLVGVGQALIGRPATGHGQIAHH